MTHSIRLLVLSYTRIREKMLVLQTLSTGYGRRSFVVTVSRMAPMAFFLPLNILDAEVTENPKSELWRLGNIALVHPLDSIRGSVYKNTMALFMSEVLLRTIREWDGTPGLFEWACRSVLTLESMESDFSNFHICFLVELASAMGFAATPESLMPFAGAQMENIKPFLEAGFADSMLIELNGRSRSEIARVLLEYISHHTESAVNVQSLKILGEVFR